MSMLAFGMFADASSERPLSRPRRPSFVDRGSQANTSDSPRAVEDGRAKSHQSLFLQIPLDQSAGVSVSQSSKPLGVSTSSSGLDKTNSPAVTIVQRRALEINGAGFGVAPRGHGLWLVVTVSGGIVFGALIGLVAGLLVFS